MKCCLAATFLAISLASSTASATTPEVQRAFERGRSLLRDGKLDEATRQFLFVVDREPAVGALLNLAQCYERLGKKALAFERFTQAAALASEQKDDRAIEARSRAAKLEPSVARIVFAFSSQLAQHRPALVLDGESLPTSTDLRMVDAGRHTLEIRFEAPQPPETRTFEAPGGATQTVVIEPPAPASAPPTPTPVPAPTVPDPPRDRTTAPPKTSTAGSTQRWAGVGVAGVGGLGLVVGAVFGVISTSRASTLKSTCPDYPRCPAATFDSAQSTYESGKSAATISTISFIAGGVLAAGGAVLFFTAPSGAAVSVAPSPSGGTVGLSARF